MLYVQQPSSCQIYCCTSGIVYEVLQIILLLGLASPECVNTTFSQFPVGRNLTLTNVLCKGKLQLRALTNSNERAHQKVAFLRRRKYLKETSGLALETGFFFKKKILAYRLAVSLRLSQWLHMSVGISEKNSKNSYLTRMST